jgi:hypothetical protein
MFPNRIHIASDQGKPAWEAFLSTASFPSHNIVPFDAARIGVFKIAAQFGLGQPACLAMGS